VTFVSYPLPEVSCPIFPFISTKSLLHVVFVSTLILLSLRPNVESSAMHFALRPVSCINSSISHSECTFAMELVGFPLTFVNIAIAHDILPKSNFRSFYVFSFIWATISPYLFTLAVLLIIFPVAFIFLLIFIYKHTITVCLVVHPLPLINLSINLYQLTISPCFIFFPLSLILRLVWPNLHTYTFSHIIQDVSFIDWSIFKSYYFSTTDTVSCELVDLFDVLEPATWLEFMIVIEFGYSL